jgi:elongation factor Ts
VAAAAPVGVDEAPCRPTSSRASATSPPSAARAEGKPEAMIEKIVDGKIKAYYKDVALVHQMWVREPKTPVSQLIADAGQEVGAPSR